MSYADLLDKPRNQSPQKLPSISEATNYQLVVQAPGTRTWRRRK
jgi:hypothetical protein